MDRSTYIGASDAKRILDGEWLTLYQEKLGLRQPEDFTHNFQVQLGIMTERFHLNWLNRYYDMDIVVEPHQQLHRMTGMPHLACHLDGWCRTNNAFVEVKHSNGRANRDSMVEWYQPQIAHICNVLAVDRGIISYIAGNTSPDWFLIAPSHAYRKALIEMEAAFWWHIENREPPNVIGQDKLEAVRSKAREVRLDGMRFVDMSLNNQWGSLATDYQLNKDSAASFERAKKGLKDMVEPDVREASGFGITIKRSKSGSLLFGGE